MGLCNNCIQQMYYKLTQIDILTLASLVRSNNASTALTRSAILKKVTDIYTDATMHYILLSVMRLELIGFVSVIKSGRQEVVFITQDGLCAIREYGNGIEDICNK